MIFSACASSHSYQCVHCTMKLKTWYNLPWNIHHYDIYTSIIELKKYLVAQFEHFCFLLQITQHLFLRHSGEFGRICSILPFPVFHWSCHPLWEGGSNPQTIQIRQQQKSPVLCRSLPNRFACAHQRPGQAPDSCRSHNDSEPAKNISFTGN